MEGAAGTHSRPEAADRGSRGAAAGLIARRGSIAAVTIGVVIATVFVPWLAVVRVVAGATVARPSAARRAQWVSVVVGTPLDCVQELLLFGRQNRAQLILHLFVNCLHFGHRFMPNRFQLGKMCLADLHGALMLFGRQTE